MKSVVLKSSAIALLSTAWSMAAFAQSSTSSSIPSTSATPTNTSVTTISASSGTKFKLPVDLSYNVWFSGPAIADPTADNTPIDNFTDLNNSTVQDPLSARHYLTVGRRLNPTYNLTATLDFRTVLTDPAGNGRTRGFFWKDCFVRLSHAGLVHGDIGGNTFNLPADVRYYAPTSQIARENGTLGSLRFTLSPSLQFGKSIFSIGTVNYVKVWAQTQAATNQGGPLTQLEFYTGPQINAQIHKRVNLFVLYEAVTQKFNQGRDVAGQDPIYWSSDSRAASVLTDIQPGMDIQITDNFAISPYLNWYTALPISTTSMNLQLSASL